MADLNQVDHINSITNCDGVEVKGKNEVGGEFVKFFEDLFHRESNIEYRGTNFIKNFVDKIEDENLLSDLTKKITSDEIKSVIFSLNPNKAPRPDGFNGFFFQQTWDIVGSDISKSILEFFSSSSLLKNLNTTILTLIPKSQNPSTVNDFRPISCCNTIYKTISKILVNRLKPILPLVICDSQSAFVEGRSISDSIFLAQELFHGYHIKNSPPIVAVKVDFRKAYDTIRWVFLWNLLPALGIPPMFIRWVRACVSSASYLFVLAMNIFSMMLEKEAKSGTFSFHWRCAKLKITYLSFADDLLLFVKSDVDSCTILKNTLISFEKLAGLHPNHGKSSCFFASAPHVTKESILNLWGFEEGSVPFRYLEVPLITSKLFRMDCIPLNEGIKTRANNWTNRFMSFVGRFTLVNSVLMSTQIFWCSHFVLPKRVCKDIESIIRNFLWSGTADNWRKSKVSWDDVTRPKDEGGLGIRRLSDINLALMAKWTAKILDRTKTSLWVDWVHIYLIGKNTFWTIKPPSTCSWTWRKLLEMRTLIGKYLRIKVRDGSSTLVGWDPWRVDGP